MMWNGFFHASCSSLSVVFHKDKKTFRWVSSWHLQTTDLFHLLFSLPFSLLLKDPPELHSAELLTFCSSFVFVPFVSVTERERERKSSDRKNVKACLCAGGGWVGWVSRGGIRKGPGGQEAVDESRGRDWWARTGQGRSKRTATEMTSETKL